MCNVIPYGQEQLFPTRWLNGYPPARDFMASHLWHLRRTWGKAAANECKSRMLWVGIFPVKSARKEKRT